MNKKETELSRSELEGVIYVIQRGGQYLIAKRVKEDSNFRDQFLFPGGLVEEDDLSLEEAVKREIWEERGTEVRGPRFVATVEYPHPNGFLITQHVFLIEEDVGEIGNLEPEKEQLFWMTREELGEVCTSAPAKAVLNLLDESGVFNGE
jgi:8-oxo-dGTP pyrophosphatase MutT (NUDIX family)